MGRSVGPIVAAALALGACATPPEWSERVTVAVDHGGRGFAAFSVAGLSSPPMPNTDDLMLCVVGMDGAARCHHRDGIVSASVAPSAASASVPGRGRRSPVALSRGRRVSLLERGGAVLDVRDDDRRAASATIRRPSPRRQRRRGGVRGFGIRRRRRTAARAKHASYGAVSRARRGRRPSCGASGPWRLRERLLQAR